MTVETFRRNMPFRFAENMCGNHAPATPSRLLRTCACGMIAATASTKSNNQAAIRVRRDKGGLFL
jgi:hypothetical protein